MPVKILSLGDLLLDLLVSYDPQSGEVDIGPEAVQLHPGGSAANFAVHVARLGADVRYVSRVGSDMQGDMLVRSLENAGVVASVRVVDTEATGRVLVMVDSQGHRRMWSYPGASATISPDDLNPIWFQGLDAFHLTGYSLLRERPRAAAIEALRLARFTGHPLCTLDPNPPYLIEDYGPARYRELLKHLRFDIIFPNLEEGILLTGQTEPEIIAIDLLDVSPVVALTLGAEGCMVAHAEEGVQGCLSLRVPAVQAVDAPGAGDAFAAGFVVPSLDGNDLYASAVAGNSLASSVVSRAGAR